MNSIFYEQQIDYIAHGFNATTEQSVLPADIPVVAVCVSCVGCTPPLATAPAAAARIGKNVCVNLTLTI